QMSVGGLRRAAGSSPCPAERDGTRLAAIRDVENANFEYFLAENFVNESSIFASSYFKVYRYAKRSCICDCEILGSNSRCACNGSFSSTLTLLRGNERYQPSLSPMRIPTLKSSMWETIPASCSPLCKVTVARTGFSSG